MGIEDFEWEGEAELAQSPAPAAAAPRRSRHWLQALRSSVWLEPALKLAGIAALLGVLAGIGVLASMYAKPGRELPVLPRSLTDALGTSWLKPTPAEPAAFASASASALAQEAPRARSVVAAALAAPSAAASALEAPPAASAAPPAGSSAGVTADGRVILNLASAEELTRLPGIGARRAEAIVALRTRLKRFRQLTDLLRVKGIGPRGLKRMLPQLVLDAPAPAPAG